MTEESVAGSSQGADQARIVDRVERVEDSLNAISQTLKNLLESSKRAEKERNSANCVDSGTADREASEDSAIERLLNEGVKESVLKAEEEDRIVLSDLPSIENRRNNQFPEHLDELYEERAKLARRNNWPTPEAFAGSPLPVPFEPKDRAIDAIKDERNKSELKELCPVNAWLEQILNNDARVRLAKTLNSRQLHGRMQELQVRLGALHDIITRRAGFLVNQDRCGERAARAMRDASDRTRKHCASLAEERVAPIIRSEFLKAEVKSLARSKSGLKHNCPTGET